MIVKKLGTDTPFIITGAEAAGGYVYRNPGWGARELSATDFLTARATSKHTTPVLVFKR